MGGQDMLHHLAGPAHVSTRILPWLRNHLEDSATLAWLGRVVFGGRAVEPSVLAERESGIGQPLVTAGTRESMKCRLRPGTTLRERWRQFETAPQPQVAIPRRTRQNPAYCAIHDGVAQLRARRRRRTYFGFVWAMAWRTWPPDCFKAAAARERLTRPASITNATGVRFPAAARVRRAFSRSAPVARSRIPMAR